jgi:hypothetical protein
VAALLTVAISTSGSIGCVFDGAQATLAAADATPIDSARKATLADALCVAHSFDDVPSLGQLVDLFGWKHRGGWRLISGCGLPDHAKPEVRRSRCHWRLDTFKIDRRVHRVQQRRVETAALRCQRSVVSIEVSPNSPRSAKSTASETPGGGGSAAGGTSSAA